MNDPPDQAIAARREGEDQVAVDRRETADGRIMMPADLGDGRRDGSSP